MFEGATFDDGRGKYPDRISANVPLGLREAAREVAVGNRISLGEFTRRALMQAIIDPSVTAAPVTTAPTAQLTGAS